jgi:hypothetical protein
MSIGYSTAVRNSRLSAVVTAADANNSGGNHAKLTLYSGTRPATGGAATTVIEIYNCASPLGTVASGVLTLGALTETGTADASGTVTWARLTTNTGVHIGDFTVTATGGGGDLTMDNTSVTIGATLAPGAPPAFTITDGNP